MEDHNIDWFFSSPGLPCYSPSNGLILPDVIKVRKNRELQKALYRDIVDFCKPLLQSEGLNLTYKKIEYTLFYHELESFENSGIALRSLHPLESYLYLTDNEYFVFPACIDYLLNLEFGIDVPTEEHRASFFYGYIEMARRGFACLYPYKEADGSDEIRYMIIGFPNLNLLNERYDKTFAARLYPRLPRYDDAALTYIQKQESLSQVEAMQALAQSKR